MTNRTWAFGWFLLAAVYLATALKYLFLGQPHVMLLFATAGAQFCCGCLNMQIDQMKRRTPPTNSAVPSQHAGRKTEESADTKGDV